MRGPRISVAGELADRFTWQLREDSKAKGQTLAKQLAEKSDGKYTQAQIEDQMRIMDGLIDGGVSLEHLQLCSGRYQSIQERNGRSGSSRYGIGQRWTRFDRGRFHRRVHA